MSVLRWAHDRHRNFRSLESAQGATTSAKLNRDDSFVTRHGLDHTRATATVLRPMAHLVPDVVNGNPMVFFDHYSSTRNRQAARQYHNNATCQTHRSVGQA